MDTLQNYFTIIINLKSFYKWFIVNLYLKIIENLKQQYLLEIIVCDSIRLYK